MLCAVTCETAHLFGDVMPQLLRLRYDAFVKRQNYACFTVKDMEYDRYDHPATVYINWIDDYNGKVLGTIRLNPTTTPYMLKEVWGERIDYPLPEEPEIWEGSRIAIDSDQPAALRQRIIKELVLGYAEYCQKQCITGILGTMPHVIWQRVFTRNGWPVKYISSPLVFGKKEPSSIPGLLPFDEETLYNVRKATGITRSLLHYAPPIQQKKELA